MSTEVSPLAPKTDPVLPPIDGVRIETAEAGIKYKGRTDLMVMVFDDPAEVAGVFTTSKCPSAPVDLCRANLAGGVARALVVNSGNANAFTGVKGAKATALTAEATAEAVGCAPSEVFLASTGVIGEPLAAEKFTGLLGGMAKSAVSDRWAEAAKAIMTTDTYPKVATRAFEIAGKSCTLNGIAKGAGMIAPDMATMLSFLVTDAPVAGSVLQALLSAHVGATYNAVTVDSDTSTSDTDLLFSIGGTEITDAADPRLDDFREALRSLMEELVSRSSATARARASRWKSGLRVLPPTRRPAASPARSPTRRWSRRRSPARTPTGAASSWPSARPARKPTATGSPSGSAISASPSMASAIPTTAKTRRRR